MQLMKNVISIAIAHIIWLVHQLQAITLRVVPVRDVRENILPASVKEDTNGTALRIVVKPKAVGLNINTIAKR